MLALVLSALSFTIPALAADKSTAPQLIELAKSNSPGLPDAITGTFDAKELKEGTASASRGPDFFFALESASQPVLIIDAAPGPAMTHPAGSNLWYASAHIEPVGRLHSFHYIVDGANFGGRLDFPAFAHQQNLRRHEERLLDLRSGAVRSTRARGVDGVSGRRGLPRP
jgi:enterochelin esterase family protein